MRKTDEISWWTNGKTEEDSSTWTTAWRNKVWTHTYIYIYNFRTNEVKFAWIGCMFKMIFASLTIMIYIYTYNFRINDMKFAWISCISDHFCILRIWWYIYRLILFRTNDMKIAYIWLHFRSFLCILQNTDICIYIYIFRTNYMKFVWIGCMSDHVCILQKMIYI